MKNKIYDILSEAVVILIMCILVMLPCAAVIILGKFILKMLGVL